MLLLLTSPDYWLQELNQSSDAHDVTSSQQLEETHQPTLIFLRLHV